MAEEIAPVLCGDVRLLRWQDNQLGRTVTLELDPDLAEHPFRGLKCGTANGQRLKVVAVMIDDNEEPVSAAPQVCTTPRSAEPVKSSKPFSSLPRSQQAGIKLNDPEFCRWIEGEYLPRFPVPIGEVTPGHNEQLKALLGIDSKKDLDAYELKGKRWDAMLVSFKFKDQTR